MSIQTELQIKLESGGRTPHHDTRGAALELYLKVILLTSICRHITISPTVSGTPLSYSASKDTAAWPRKPLSDTKH